MKNEQQKQKIFSLFLLTCRVVDARHNLLFNYCNLLFLVIIENIVEDSIEVKYEDESTTHNLQVSVDLLKMTIQYVDFLGVENFNFIIHPVLIDVANKLKVDEKKFYATFYEGFNFQNRIKLLKHLKYLFIWSGRF